MLWQISGFLLVLRLRIKPSEISLLDRHATKNPRLSLLICQLSNRGIFNGKLTAELKSRAVMVYLLLLLRTLKMRQDSSGRLIAPRRRAYHGVESGDTQMISRPVFPVNSTMFKLLTGHGAASPTGLIHYRCQGRLVPLQLLIRTAHLKCSPEIGQRDIV